MTVDVWSCRGESKIIRIELIATFNKMKYSQNLLVNTFRMKLRNGLEGEKRERDLPSRTISFVIFRSFCCFTYFVFYWIVLFFNNLYVDDICNTLFLFTIAFCKFGLSSNFLSITYSKDKKCFIECIFLILFN